MANVFKRLVGTPTRKAYKKGNLARGIGSEAYGPTSQTGYYAGITPPTDGYVITTINGSNLPEYRIAHNDTEFIQVARDLGGSVSTIDQAKVYLAGRSNTIIYDSLPETTFTTDKLVLHMTGNNMSSYPGTGTYIYDISGNGFTGTMENGVGYNSTDKSITFDGVDDRISITNSSDFGNFTWSNGLTLAVLFKVDPADFTSDGQYRAFLGVASGQRSFNYYLRRASSNTLQFHFSALGYGSLSNVFIANSARYYLAMFVQQSNGNGVYYLNNASWGSHSQNNVSPSYSSTSTQYIGRADNLHAGSLGKVLIYNKPLSTEERDQVYYNGDIVTSNLAGAYDIGTLVSDLNGTSIWDLTNSSDFTTEGTVSKLNTNGGVVKLNSGRIYRPTSYWYGKMSTSWWMKYNGSISASYFYTESYRGSGGCARIYSYINSEGKFVFQVWDNSSYAIGMSGTRTTVSTTNVCDGKWHHVTCQWSNGSGNKSRGMYVYINGKQEGWVDAIGNDGGYQHFHLGGVTGCLGTSSHNVELGPILHYKNYNLSDAEVLQNYNAHRARFKE